MSEFKGVTVVKEANIYFDGKVTSRTVLFPDGSKKTLGVMLPGEYEFGTGDIVAVVGLMFAWLGVRAFAIGKEAVAYERHFSALLAQGIGIWIGVQAIINMGVNMGLLP